MFSHAQIWLGIDRLAKSFGYSPSGLARKAGLDSTSFNKSKRISPDGKPRWPSTESISKILAVTGATMTDLFALIEDGEDLVLPAHGLSDKEIAAQTARILIETESVLFNAHKPFTLKSGKSSPVYVDCRRLISFPKERKILMDFAATLLKDKIGDNKIDYLAGGETAGIPYAAFIAERLNKPMLYVRKEAKGHGRTAQIEGALPEKGRRNTVLIEDLQTDGGSKKVFVNALKKAGATIKHGFVIFHYGIFSASEKNMKDMGMKLHALATWWDVLETASTENYFDNATLESVEAFLNNPDKWS